MRACFSCSLVHHKASIIIITVTYSFLTSQQPHMTFPPININTPLFSHHSLLNHVYSLGNFLLTMANLVFTRDITTDLLKQQKTARSKQIKSCIKSKKAEKSKSKSNNYNHQDPPNPPNKNMWKGIHLKV